MRGFGRDDGGASRRLDDPQLRPIVKMLKHLAEVAVVERGTTHRADADVFALDTIGGFANDPHAPRLRERHDFTHVRKTALTTPSSGTRLFADHDYMSAMLWRVSGRPPRSLPLGFIKPALAALADKVPSGPGWLHEIKHDGYRMQVRKDGDRVRLFTRNGIDWTARYSQVSKIALSLKGKTASIDGELCCVGKDGIADFAKLHSRCADDEAIFYAFDLLELDDEDLRKRPLIERKAILAETLAASKITAGIHLVDHATDDGPSLFAAACRMGLEGIVSKKANGIYRSGNCKTWFKIKNKKAPGWLRVRDGLDG